MKKINSILSIVLILTGISAHAQVTINYTGAVQNYTVPPCVYSMGVDVKGASGGSSGVSIGGLGGRVQATMTVTPGTVFSIYVGGVGTAATDALGGWNGGGNTGTGTGASGGGASDIRQGGTALTNRIIVAAGGAGTGTAQGVNDNGGNGGGLAGANGTQGGTYGVANCGAGGSQTAGGAAATGGSATPGTLGIGGNGGYHGGGGGGGYYGGGGGAGAQLCCTGGGGGGGSSYAGPVFTGVVHTAGAQSGNGQVILTPVFTPAPAAAGSINGPSAVCGGTTATYSIAPIPNASTYTWTVSSGIVINSPPGTTSISVTFGSASGNISVSASNICGPGPATSMAVTVTPEPTFTGLDSSYCLNDPAAALTGSPSGGTFSGPGISGSDFTPAAAGTGTHLINYGLCNGMYSVSQSGTFAPVSGSGTSVVLGDDEVTPSSMPIGFSFKFYCMDYTDFYISSNGFITFNSGSGNGCCSGDVLPNNDAFLSNMIAFCWIDLYPPGGGTIEYFNTGTSPNKKLVVNFTGIPYFGGGSPITSQVVISETSNMIEIHTTDVPGNGGFQTMGIENDGGTIAAEVSGRNGVPWSASNDYTKFIPLECTATQMVTVDSCNPVGVSSVNANMNITIVPNPTSGKIEVATAGGSGSQYDLEIYNVFGEKVSSSISLPSGGQGWAFDISSSPQGIYFLKLISDNGTITKKIIRK